MSDHACPFDETLPFKRVHAAVLTISDTRDIESDTSGALLANLAQRDGHHVAARAIVHDDVGEIRAQVSAWLDDAQIDVIVSTGGTGLTGRDVTVEALRPLFDKEIEGFGVVFHMISFQKIHTSTVQSRATAGVMDGKYVFCLPGSPGACKDAWDEILVHQLDYRHHPCNFIEIMPRLDEHLKRTKG